MVRVSHARVIVPAAAAVAAVGVIVWSRFHGAEPGAGRAPVDGSLNARLRAAALANLPDKDAVLTLGNPTWDLILGGRKPDYLGGPTWGYYATYAGQNPDGTKRKGGTTCGTVNAYWAGKAGFPVDMIDRLPSDPVPGSGFQFGESISKFYAGARRRGWVVTASAPASARVAGLGDAADARPLRPGDYYCVVHDGATYNGQPSSGEHVGVILDVSGPNAEGARTVRTADGGQLCGPNGDQCAHWNTRTLTSNGQLVLNGSAGRLAWVVRAT